MVLNYQLSIINYQLFCVNVYKSFDEIDFNPDTVLTVGTFDGVHCGHQVIIRKLIETARKDNLRALIITIHPHPQIVLRKDNKEPIFILTSISERLKLFEKFGINDVLIIPFSYEFSLTPPEVFIREYLHKKVGFNKILIGYDHLFGKDRQGNEELLLSLKDELKFEIVKIDPLTEHDLIISSTKIRNELKDKDIELANAMLGYDYFVNGIVVEGDKRGRTIRYPTANLLPDEPAKLMPPDGVYFVKVQIDDRNFFGMGSIGTRPTFKENDPDILEVYIFDFNEDIYGKDISVVFLKFIRSQIKFGNVDDLIVEIKNDEKICREMMKNA